MMSQPDLGTKRVCVSCGARFYDLNRSPAVCPKCNTEQPDLIPRLRRNSDTLSSDTSSLASKQKDEDDLETDTDTDDVDVLEDSSDLDDDADDISSDIDVPCDDEDDHES